jgi:eukaryotic-like serine/threonine-protein kinase
MPTDPRRVKALFLAALDLPDSSERPAFLDRECGEDNELRQRLEALLAAHDQPASELERPIAASPEAVAPPLSDSDATADGSGPTPVARERRIVVADQTVSFRPDNPPTGSLIGTIVAERYKIRQEIGEGGMGNVYLAEQLQPVRRQVALKLIKAGMDTRNVLARFESERQALALMDHPNIAKVLDAGTTDAGRPFFVMELVKGIPLTDYCDQHRLGLPERLDLFRQICSAVQHAHQKGIIHRDLKPTNILVESHDDKPVPKVIDFGLAKATGGMRLTEQSLFTAFGGVAGTPLYMAPEQASFNALDVDTRADVYALGVILYELLTGSTPIRREAFQNAALDEMLRVIREVEPPTPSSRLSTSDALPSLAANRHIEPSRLSRFVRGDLDWIAMKALAKERQRRYDSAIGLANDLERFTNHEPVVAGPPSSVYRFRKFVRRNRPQVVAASLILLTLVAGVVGTSLGLFEARKQQQIAEGEAKEKEKARQQAVKRLAQIEKTNEILGSIFKDLNPSHVEEGDKPLSAVLGERLDQATAQIEGEAIGDQTTVARMQITLGLSQLGLGYPEKAIDLFTKARAAFASQLGPDHPDTLNSMNLLAHGYQVNGQVDRALPLFEETLALRKSKLGLDHHSTLASLSNLANAYRAAYQYDRALPLLEESYRLTKAQLGPDHPDTLVRMNNLAIGYKGNQRDRAIALLEESLKLTKARFGPDHPNTLASMANLAGKLSVDGQHDRALSLFQETLALSKIRLGPDHPDTLNFMDKLATFYPAGRGRDRVLSLREEVLALSKTRLGPYHVKTLTRMRSLADAYEAVNQRDRALPLYEETLALMKARLGPDHTDTLVTMTNLASAYQLAGQHDRSLPLLERALALKKAKLGPDHALTFGGMYLLARGYQAAGQHDRALPLFEESLALQKSKIGPDHADTLKAMNNLVLGYQAAGRFDRALPLLRELADLQKRKAGSNSPQYAGALASLGHNLLLQKMWTEAEPILRESLTIREEKEPEVWSTYNTRSQLGGALLGQKKYAEAEPLLQAGYEGMKQRAAKIPPTARTRPVEALDRLIELAEATGKPDEAKARREEKAKLAAPTDGKKP